MCLEQIMIYLNISTCSQGNNIYNPKPDSSMRHYQFVDGSPPSGANPLLVQVYEILDSRIQFIDYQVQRYYSQCISRTPQKVTDDNYCGPSSIQSLVANFDDLLHYTLRLQDDLKLLQTLRTWLKEETLAAVLDLLTDNKYLNYNGLELESLLQEQARTFAEA